jgi:long-chain acyl-CoA synthetase
MLYDCWRKIAHHHQHETALRELTSARTWTFQQLAQAAETDAGTEEPVVFPQSISADFILTLLRAWRKGQVVCPLEIEQKPSNFEKPCPGIVHLKMTSATTGIPRLIGFTAPQLIADARNIVQTMGLRPDWPNLGVISLAHSYGFSNLVLPLLLHGIPLLLLDSPLPERLRRALADFDQLTLPAVPTLWRAWAEARVLNSSVRLAISAGASLPLALEEELFTTLGLKLHNFYGASECGGIAYDPSERPRDNAAYVGEPMRHVDLSISQSGCLRVRSQAVGETYLPEPSPELQNGVFLTSDLAEITHGKVYLSGRATDLINVAGRKVAPELIENALRMHPHVRDCLVFGSPRSEHDRTERIVACVETNTPTDKDNLQTFLLKQLPAWQVPRDWRFVPLSPNGRGKLSRAEWRQKILRGHDL